MSDLEKSIDSLGETANRIADERNKFKAQRDVLLAEAKLALRGMEHFSSLYIKALRHAINVCEGKECD